MVMVFFLLLWQMNIVYVVVIDFNCIVVLEWLLVELLLVFGIVFYGVVDIINYCLWVSELLLLDLVIDVGLCIEFNFELLIEMKLLFMVWLVGYGFLLEMLVCIVLGCGFNFSDGKQLLVMVCKLLMEMVDLFNL